MNWRPIKSAPKDRNVLLKYPRFDDPSKSVVTQGRWIEVHPHGQIMDWLNRGVNPHHQPARRCWVVAYVALLDCGGRWNGTAFEHRRATVVPTHWQPLPK